MKFSAMRRSRPLIILVAFLLVAAIFPARRVRAHAVSLPDSLYDFCIDRYDVLMTIDERRQAEVTETLTVRFNVEGKSGIIRDLPLDKGLRYSQISATRDGGSLPIRFESDSTDMLSVYLGSEGRRLDRGTYVYRITYRMIFPALKEEGYLPIDLIGMDWQAPISNVNAVVVLPDGLKEHRVYSDAEVTSQREGNTVTVTRAGSYYGYGITLDLSFEEGALKAPPADLAPLWASLCALGAILLALILKLLFCRAPLVIRSVNIDAPDGMDPLRMGKKIDARVDPEDLGSLVFWLASGGYLRIDMTDEDNPVLEVTGKSLPPDTPDYVVTFYDGLFNRRESVSAVELTGSFYGTAERVKNRVNATEKPYFKKAGGICLGILAAVCILLFGGFAFLFAAKTISAEPYLYRYFPPFALVAGSFAVAAAGAWLSSRNRYKWKKGKVVLVSGLTFLCGCALSLLSLLFPCPAFGGWTVVILQIGAAAAGSLSGFFRVPTKEYAAELGKILGFRDFLVYTAKDKIAFMLKKDPELYYRTLPYAQVLGVTDAWTEKFEGLDLEPPAWLYGGDFTPALALIWQARFLTFTACMARSIVPPPSNRGGGFHGGGFGGGFTGGGFGGGGGRSF